MSDDCNVDGLCKDITELRSELDTEDFTELDRAFQILKSLSAVGRDIPETMFKVYTAGVGIRRETLYGITSYFEGAGLINIICDCYDGGGFCEKPHHIDNKAYDNGLIHLRAEDEGFTKICDQIKNIQDLYR
jgi:hypothetical protein